MIYTEDFFSATSIYPNDDLVQLVDSHTNENVNFKKTLQWHNGSPIISADGIIYRKRGNDYYVDVDWLTNRTIYVKRFGAKGDGLTNDAPAIRRMIEFTPEKDFIIVFENAKYLQGDGTYDRYDLHPTTNLYSGEINIGEEIFFSFKDKSDFAIYGNGAFVIAHPNNAPIINARGFEFLNCSNFKVENLNYDGSKNTRKPDGGDDSPYNNQSGFRITSCKKYEFSDCRSNNTCMDGFLIDSDDLFTAGIENWNEDGIIRNCHADNNYRQGCSVVDSKRLKIIGGSYTNTGKTYGTLPKDGIDIEQGFVSNFGRGSSDTIIENVLFENNLGDGLALHLGTHDSTVTHCIFKNNPFFVAQDWNALTCNNTIYNNNFYDSSIVLNGEGEHFYSNKIYLSSNYNFNFEISYEYDHFNKKRCRETLIYDNYIHRDAGSSNIGDVLGIFKIGKHKEGVKVFKNTFINLASKGNFLYMYGEEDRNLEFFDNLFHNTEEFSINTNMNPNNIYYTNSDFYLKRAYNNKIEIKEMPPMVSVANICKGNKLIKSFNQKRIPSGKFIDVTFDYITSDFEARDLYLKITTNGYWFDNNSTSNKEEIVSLLNLKTISYTDTIADLKKLPISTGLYIKNNKATITFKQSNEDTAINTLWDLDIVIEILGKYTDDFPVILSDTYDTNNQTFIIDLPIIKSEHQTNSNAIDLISLRNDFNNLLIKLKNSGIMQN
nr:right-handed parallel beta-helix repeat-containing protein [uncultured Chryseobacterium sp.]